jgi:glycosyltransferase involved in cell wall biosynthesis
MTEGGAPSEPPLVTVAMPVYNAARHLRAAVLSVIQQTFTDWELLLIDDGSSDGAIEALAALEDPRIRILRDGCNAGIAVRLNQALDVARGKYFARMDADDIAFPQRFCRQVAMLQSRSELDVLATRAITIDEADRVRGAFPCAVSHEEISARPWLGFHFPHPTWMGRTEWFRKHRYAVPAPYLCEDQELLLRSHSSSRFASVDEVLLGYRIRTRPDWRKVAKIRRAMLRQQVLHFLRAGQWRFAVLALFAFAAKTGRDVWRRLRQASAVGSDQEVTSDVHRQWNEVLIAVANDGRLP